MTDKRSIGLFAAGLLTAAALYGIYVWVHPMTGGDDDPIVVAGGSLDITSGVGFQQDAQDKQKANHLHTKRHVTAVEVIYWDGGPASVDLPGGPVKVEIAYCPGACLNVNQPDDMVTFETTNPNGKKLIVRNSSVANPIGVEAGPGSTKWSHQPNWQANQITVNGVPYKCYQGKCKVKLHYYCDNTGQCK